MPTALVPWSGERPLSWVPPRHLPRFPVWDVPVAEIYRAAKPSAPFGAREPGAPPDGVRRWTPQLCGVSGDGRVLPVAKGWLVRGDLSPNAGRSGESPWVRSRHSH